MAKYTGRGLVVKQPGVLSKVQMLNLVLGVGVFPFFNLENLETHQSVENKGESDRLLDILENEESLEILEIPPAESRIVGFCMVRSRVLSVAYPERPRGPRD